MLNKEIKHSYGICKLSTELGIRRNNDFVTRLRQKGVYVLMIQYSISKEVILLNYMTYLTSFKNPLTRQISRIFPHKKRNIYTNSFVFTVILVYFLNNFTSEPLWNTNRTIHYILWLQKKQTTFSSLTFNGIWLHVQKRLTQWMNITYVIN